MHDIVKSGGTVRDGTGAPGFTGDVAIDGDKLVAAGGKAGPAGWVVDAGRQGQDAGARPARFVRAGR